MKQVIIESASDIDVRMIEAIKTVVGGEEVLLFWCIYGDNIRIRFSPREVELTVFNGRQGENDTISTYSLHDAAGYRGRVGTPVCLPNTASDIKPLQFEGETYHRIIWDICTVVTQAEEALIDCPDHVLDGYGRSIVSVVKHLYHAHKIRSYSERSDGRSRWE